jgi:hypothetical protein
MEVVQTSGTLLNSYQSTRRYNPDDSHLHSHQRQDLKSYLIPLSFVRRSLKLILNISATKIKSNNKAIHDVSLFLTVTVLNCSGSKCKIPVTLCVKWTIENMAAYVTKQTAVTRRKHCKHFLWYSFHFFVHKHAAIQYGNFTEPPQLTECH